MTLVNTVIIMWIVLMISFIYNADRSTQPRTSTQVAADAAAASVGDLAADKMKDLVGLNHTIGEVCSFVIVHEAWGGPGLDEGEKADTAEFDNKLKLAHTAYGVAAQAARRQMMDTAFATVTEEVVASEESTEFETKTRLKELLTWAYGTKTVGYALVATKYPPFVAAGEAMHAAAHLFELKIYQEYQTANAIHVVAERLVPLKQLLRDTYLPALKKEADQIVKQFPDQAIDLAKTIVSTHDPKSRYVVGVIGAEGKPVLPVEIDPLAKAQTMPDLEQLVADGSLRSMPELETTAITRDQINKVTQLARTTFPWVVYHREPLLKGMKILMTLAQTHKHYKHYTEKYAKDITSQLQLENDMGLYVIKQHSINKGYQTWTEDPDLADELFSFVVVVHQDAPEVIGTPIVFSKHNTEGIFSCSQVTLYNGNLQKRNKAHIDLTTKRIRPNLQPVVGYDTLGWTEPQNELIAKTDAGGAPVPRQPKYELSWQSKLEPMSNAMNSAVRKNLQQLPSKAHPVAKKYFEDRPSELLLQ
ncbi:hypothetical protein N9Y42_02960 [Mariniblastus sp.]|nr:hypothetical protein [Mariniblastus sp.]